MIAGCLAAGSLKAQAPKDQRALSTRIADLLQQLPSAGKDRLNANMQEISAGRTGHHRTGNDAVARRQR
ncbi:hypothetical protein MKQ70_21400 [Chitinophaga sedimenti]|uniref:hypothetical protein n=1 Tax=Chitinophaga sedimenti TaxID=2033606 RepID=UPI0020053D76|nr:hypothetical protein [Chitinophaga sedimenti]MCK7557420.1 hypothetical protein [Chitinophaga sedimenti]